MSSLIGKLKTVDNLVESAFNYTRHAKYAKNMAGNSFIAELDNSGLSDLIGEDSILTQVRSQLTATYDFDGYERKDFDGERDRMHLEIFEEFRKYETVDRAIRQKVSFSDTLSTLTRKYSGWKAFLPMFVDKGFDRMVDRMNITEVFGITMFGLKTQLTSGSGLEHTRYGKIVDFFGSKIMNPVVLPIALGAAVSLAWGLFPEGLGYSKGFAFGGVLGGVFGCGIGFGRKHYISDCKRDAEYMDKRIEELY